MSKVALVVLGITVSVAAADRAAADEPAGDERPVEMLSRHRIGVDIGGTGPILFTYRGRVVGPLHLEGGMFAAPPWLMGSLGAVLETALGRRWSVYAGGGAAVIAAFDEHSCTADDDPACVDRSDWAYLHARVGVTVVVRGPTATDRGVHRIGASAGVWRGIARDHGGGELRDRRRFAIPMAGLSYSIGF